MARYPTSSPNGGKKELTPLEQQFVYNVVHKYPGNSLESARDAGYEKAEICHSALMRRLKDSVVAEVQLYLAKHSSSAAMSLVNMLHADEPIPQANTKLAAAQQILDRAGVTKVDKSEVQHNHTGGIFFIPAKSDLPTEKEIIDGEYSESWANPHEEWGSPVWIPHV